MIGNFEWSYYQRRFDGARVDVDRPHWHFNLSAFVPTQGGFEESTNLSMPKVQVGATSFTLKSSNVDWQGFGYLYRDRRGEAAVVDNTFSLDRPVDVTIATIGGSYLRVLPRQERRVRPGGVAGGANRRLVRPVASRRQRGARGRASLEARATINRGCAPATCGLPATATRTTIATARSFR